MGFEEDSDLSRDHSVSAGEFPLRFLDTNHPFDRWSPTPVFDTFWKFAAERQAIFYRRLAGHAPPWTTDPTLQTFKFTNVYRATDRVSQFLIRNVLYAGDQSPTEIFFRAILFKLFNKIETWTYLTGLFGEVRSAVPIEDIGQALSQRMKTGNKIYSSAYIMPAGRSGRAGERKHHTHLALLRAMMNEDVPERLADSSTMECAFRILRSYPLLGNFLAFQYLIDLNYSDLVRFSESDFVVPGPGARRGLAKCFLNFTASEESTIIAAVAEHQQREFEKRNLQFYRLGNRPLQLIDCQNLFCEVDKYARAAHPEVTTHSARRRIKQRFKPKDASFDCWFPPKWGINESFRAYAPQIPQPLA
jgi:alpha-glutamyl/putrescinyl thymine pyrophosphorylase clade 1